MTPAWAPQAELSLTIVGWSTPRIIGPRGAEYSAIPRGCAVAAPSRPSRRAPTAAAPIEFHAPELWYSFALRCNAIAARSATS